MPFNHIPVLFLAILTLLFCTDAQRSITSPGICLRDADCKEYSEFCGGNYKCTKRLSKNTECFSNIQCEPGLFCGETDDSDTQLCIPQNKLKQECDDTYEHSCAVDGKYTYKCSPKTFTCGYFGFGGDTCNRNDDCQNGYYCKDVGAIKGGKCMAKLSEGARCGVDADSSECKSFCATGIFDDIDNGVCTTGSKIGGPCTQNSHCHGYEQALTDPNSLGISKVVCNIPKGFIGICEHERDLIKKEGVSCNPAKDTCDAMRGLSCRSTPMGPKCMFNAYDSDSPIRFCNKDGKFSKCNLKNGIPTECRLNDDSGSPFGSLYRGFYQCLRRLEIIPHGKPCNDVVYARCEKGTSCETVPGVEQRFLQFAKVAKFCVKVQKEGKRCFNKFKYGCANGLKCEKNICVKGTPSRTYTHSYLGRRCDMQPCVPGFECVTESGFSTCQRKTIKKNKGSCFSTAFTQTVSFSHSTNSVLFFSQLQFYKYHTNISISLHFEHHTTKSLAGVHGWHYVHTE